LYTIKLWARIAELAQRLAVGWTLWGMNPGWGEIFCTRSDQPWGPPRLLHNGYRVFPGVQRPGNGTDHPTSNLKKE